MNQKALDIVHEKIDTLLDYIQDYVYDKTAVDVLIERREELHTAVDRLRKIRDIDDLVERSTPLNFHPSFYDEEETD